MHTFNAYECNIMGDIVCDQFKDEDLMFIDVNKTYQCSIYDSDTSTQWSLLMKLVLIKNVDPELIKMIIKNTNINYKNNIGKTALMIACANSGICNNLHIIKILLESNADVNLVDNLGFSALILASRDSHEKSTLETVKLLLNSNVNINAKTNIGNTALMFASTYSNKDSGIEKIKLLLESNADINIKNKHGVTAVMSACANSNTTSNIETVKLLLQYNADINVSNNNGKTPLTYAIMNNKKDSTAETVNVLLNHMINNNIDVKITNDMFKLMDNDILNYFIYKNIHTYKNILIDLKNDINDIIKFTDVLFNNHLYHKKNFNDVIKDIIKHRNAYYFHHDKIYSRMILLCNDCFSHDKITETHIAKIKMLLGNDEKKTLMEFKDYLTG